MRVQVKCSCGWEFMAEAGPVGRTLQCPECGQALSAPDAPGATAGPAPGAPAGVASQPPQSPMAPPPAGQFMDASWVSPGTYVATPKPPAGLAVTSMVCGIVSLLGCPCCIAPLGIVIGTVAVVLGAISLAKKRGGRGMAIAGVVTGAVGIVISLGFLSLQLAGFPGSMFTPGAGPGPATWPAATVSSGGPSLPGEAPDLMTGDEVTEALTGPLDLPRNAAKAEAELRMALLSYPRRGQDPLELYECVQMFRRYLARSGLSAPADAEHAEMFRTAGDELIDLVLADYRKAGQLEQDGDWAKAEKAYGKMLEYLPDGGGLVAENVRSRRDWCKYRRQKAENEVEEPGVYQFEE